MDQRFAPRREELLNDAVCTPELTDGTLERLVGFLEPYVTHLAEPEQRTHTREYVQGLFSKLERKTGEAIAYLHDHERQGLQKFIGSVPWQHAPLLTTLAQQVGAQLGEADGVLVFDPSAFAKKGKKSVGVARQWCGRLGKVENCQVGVFMGYVSRHEHALVDVRLYLPREWTTDRQRCQEAGVPVGTNFQTRHELALAMLDEQGPALPHAWVTGDDEMGRPAAFRAALRTRGERYLLAVPSNTLIRDLTTAPAALRGRPYQQVKQWCAALPETAWVSLEVRAGTKGPLMTEAVQVPVTAKLGSAAGPEERLFVTRERQSDGSYKQDYYLAYLGAVEATLGELARVAKAEHRIEECLQRGKSEAGLGDYQVRNWVGWHHHLTLSLLAAWFLVEETRRGKKTDPGADRAAPARPHREPVGRPARLSALRPRLSPRHPLADTKRTGTLLSLPRA